MVSLAPSQGQGQGGYFFSDRDSLVVPSEDVDLLNESNHLSPVVNRAHFVPLYISWIVGFEALMLVVFEVMIFVLAQVMHVSTLRAKDPPFSFLALLHVLLWIVMMFCHVVLSYQREHLRLRGYLRFYRQTKNLQLVPPLVLSIGNAVLLAFFSVLDHAWANTSFHYYYFLQILYSLEFLILFPILIYYIAKVISFDNMRALPDAYTIIDHSVRMDAEGEIGYSDNGPVDEILEKQADMIRYLQQHNENLSRRLLSFSCQPQSC